jgi:hypothetical protein
VFLPFSEREYEVDQIVFGRSGTGSGSGSGARTGGGAHEIVVQVLVRDGQERGKRRAIERVLEAWSSERDGACELGELHGLASVMRPVPRAEEEVRSFVVIPFYPMCTVLVGCEPISNAGSVVPPPAHSVAEGVKGASSAPIRQRG